ncbi:hypothetical protein Tsubulata_006099 [Turnera subulata]|uniref:DUF7811 domain-containing protein n=1 Tax=Turnera subulata TaxID=218843 RepID=A0A9Q0FV87_9ROSI|nr:hypothetical protein Tsubulata_006099 [Turnera subulata]
MAEATLCFSTFSSLSLIPREQQHMNSFPSSPKLLSLPPPRSLRFIPRSAASHSGFNDHDPFSPFSPCSHNVIEWVQEERVTLFTADGLVQIGGSMVPRFVNEKQGKSKTTQRFQRFQESDYMDPKQELCLGALFYIAATNGLDTGRRLCIFGFCRSIEMLSDVVEDTVLEHGGEVVAAEKAIKGGLHEKLTMTVAVPYLWGVPPASETLRLAVRSGGGIVDKVTWQWDFL